MRWTVYDKDQTISDGWLEVPLANVSRRRRGYSWTKEQEAPTAEPGAIPVVRIPNVGDNLDLSDLLYLRGVSERDVAEFAIEKDWILYVGSNGNPDRIGDSVFLRSDERMLFASFLQAITTKEQEMLLPEFLALWMRLHRVHEMFSKTSQQTTGLANFSWSAVKNLPVRFPVSVEQQRAILGILSTANEVLRAGKHELEKAQRLKTALLQELFIKGLPGRHRHFKQTKIGQIPEEWTARTIQSVLADPPFSGVSPESRPDPPGTPILNVSCVKSGRCDPAALTYVDVDRVTIDECQAQKGDFFVLRGNGNREYVATGGLLEVEPPRDCIFSDKLIRLRFNTETVVEGFIPFMWQSYRFLRRLQSKAESGSGLWMMSKRDIRKELFAYPRKDEQKEIVATLRSAQAMIDSCNSKAVALERLKRSLLQNLLTSRIGLSQYSFGAMGTANELHRIQDR